MGRLVHSEEPLNAETVTSVLARTDLTPVDAFYVRTHGPVPEPSAPWRLAVDGLVERPLSLTLEDLRRFAVRELVVTLQCAGNRRAGLIAVRDIPGEIPWGSGAIGTAVWRGVALADVLEEAGLDDDASDIELIGADTTPEGSYAVSIPREKALGGEVLLAWEMNGAPLPPVHGAPLRALVPGYIGARSAKWLTTVRALAEPSSGHYQAEAYRLDGIALGAVAVDAEILVPADGAVVPAGALEVVGYAFAGDDRAIVRVDVSRDGGESWSQAELLDDCGPWAWRRWRLSLEAAPGPLELVARAWDSAGATQPEDPATVWNPGGYVNNAWSRVRLRVASSSR
jgi:sulfite oxidase